LKSDGVLVVLAVQQEEREGMILPAEARKEEE